MLPETIIKQDIPDWGLFNIVVCDFKVSLCGINDLNERKEFTFTFPLYD
jgi:hypothetical protein